MKRPLSCLVAAVAVASTAFACHRSPAGPSVLLVTIDTLRADHLGAYGYAKPTSPSLDALARESVVFENAFCVMPTTVPSHASLLFGTWPRVHGSLSNFMLVTNPKLAFLPASFRDAGYRTGAVVSANHLGEQFRRIPGFETVDFPDDNRDSKATLDVASAWLGNHRSEKTFLWLHLWDPHAPYLLHPEIMPRINPAYRDDFHKTYAFHEPGVYDAAGIQGMIDLYDNEIAYADGNLGAFLDELRRTGVLDRTIVVVTSDHGETLGELDSTFQYAFDHGEFLHDHQLHIPLIVRLPGQAPHRVPDVVSMIDVMPTIMEAAGVPIPASVAGRSALALVRGQKRTGPEEAVFLQRRDFEKPARPFLADPQFGIRESRYKLLLEAKTGQAALYRNGAELAPVTDPPASAAMSKRLDEWLDSTGKLASGESRSVTDEEAEKLRSLGYAQ